MRDSVKNALKAGIFFGIAMGLFFGLINSFVEGILFGVIYGLTIGIITGIIFGLLMFLFIHFQFNLFKELKRELSIKEKIIYDGPANHFLGREAVGGWLFLTERTLKFVSHKYNIQNHMFEIPRSEINAVSMTKTLKLVRNGLIVESKSGQRERFVVNYPKVWNNHISNYLEVEN